MYRGNDARTSVRVSRLRLTKAEKVVDVSVKNVFGGKMGNEERDVQQER
jgi:hypothetical protein